MKIVISQKELQAMDGVIKSVFKAAAEVHPEVSKHLNNLPESFVLGDLEAYQFDDYGVTVKVIEVDGEKLLSMEVEEELMLKAAEYATNVTYVVAKHVKKSKDLIFGIATDLFKFVEGCFPIITRIVAPLKKPVQDMVEDLKIESEVFVDYLESRAKKESV